MQCTRTQRIFWSISIIVLLMLMVSSVALASSPEQEEPPPPDEETGPIPPLEPPEVLPPGEGEVAELEGAMLQEVQAAPAAEINYQGFLTDAGGSPLDGEYDIGFSLHTTSGGGGTAVWGPEVHLDVPVNKGLFHVTLGRNAHFDLADFGDQLYLQVQVGSTILPRQMFRAVPYAMGLVNGATVRGASADETDYGFSVFNDGGRGIHANAKGDGSYAIYSDDVVFSAEGYAGPLTYLWVPGTDLELYYGDVGLAVIDYSQYGLARIDASANGQSVWGILPVQLDRPYGRNYRLLNIALYYKVVAPSSITDVVVQGRNFNNGDFLEVEVSNADGASTTYAVYSIPIDPPFVINSQQTVTNLLVKGTTGTPNGQNGFIDIYGMRLTLDSNY